MIIETAMRYWVNTVSRDHVQRGVAGGFTQADHGKDTRLKRMSKGDRIVLVALGTAFSHINLSVAVIAIGTHAIAAHRCYHLYVWERRTAQSRA